jgi:hypothetical protein
MEKHEKQIKEITRKKQKQNLKNKNISENK